MSSGENFAKNLEIAKLAPETEADFIQNLNPGTLAETGAAWGY